MNCFKSPLLAIGMFAETLEGLPGVTVTTSNQRTRVRIDDPRL